MTALPTKPKGFVADGRPKSFRLEDKTQLTLLDLMIALGGVTATAAVEYAITHASPPSADTAEPAVTDHERAKTALRRSVKRAIEFQKEFAETTAMEWPAFSASIKSEIVARAQTHLEQLVREIDDALLICETALSQLLPTQCHYERLVGDINILKHLLIQIRTSRDSATGVNRQRLDAYVSTLENQLRLLEGLGIKPLAKSTAHGK